MRVPIYRIFLAILFSCVSASAQTRQVAITIDDLPRGGDGGPSSLNGIRSMTGMLLKPFHDEKIPVIGFVNEGRHQLTPVGLRTILDIWLDAGAELGNHGYSHADINNLPLEAYTADILKGEPVTRTALAARGKSWSSSAILICTRAQHLRRRRDCKPFSIRTAIASLP